MTDAVAPAPSSGVNQKYLHGYLAWLRNEKQYSELTAENYARDLRHLFELAADTPLADLKIHHIRRYIAQLHSQGLGGRSLARMLSAWRGFFTYLMRDHGLTDNPCVGLRAPKSPKTLPQALSPDEATRMVDLPTDTTEAIRDKAIFELFYSSGLRLAELVDLDPAQLDLNAGEVRVTGKGSKTRIVPLGQFAITALQAWLVVRDQLAKRGRDCAVRRPARVAHLAARGAAAHEAVGHQTGHHQQRASASAAPLVRHPCAAIFRRPARGAGNARPRQHLHHPGLYPSRFSVPQQDLRCGPSARQEKSHEKTKEKT